MKVSRHRPFFLSLASYGRLGFSQQQGGHKGPFISEGELEMHERGEQQIEGTLTGLYLCGASHRTAAHMTSLPSSFFFSP